MVIVTLAVFKRINDDLSRFQSVAQLVAHTQYGGDNATAILCERYADRHTASAHGIATERRYPIHYSMGPGFPSSKTELIFV